MVQKLMGKVAVVTGSGNGIGREVALLMAAEGAKVVVNDVAQDSDGTKAADRVVKEITGAGGTAVANNDSVASMTGGESIIGTAIKNYGRIDILVNNAGNFVAKPTIEHTEQDWTGILDVHLKGLFACSQAAVREMIKQKSGGRIINITSAAAWMMMAAKGHCLAYATSKAGVLGFTKSLSLEMAEYGITVNAISPNAVTQLFPWGGKSEGGPREGPEFVAPVIAYLATDEAKDITAQIIYSGAGDIGVHEAPLQMPGEDHFIHKTGKWTIEELIEAMPKIVR
jgi:NAD(P)-dependent dehydrogenase (short-subunit alcohol dehydrogenase family)